MSYIEYKEVTVTKLTCSHPRVKNIWEVGALAAVPNTATMERRVNIILDDGTREEFIDDGSGKAVEDLEKYLLTI